MANKPHALIIDDEPDLLSLLSISLGRMGINSTKAGDVKTAIKRLNSKQFDVCLTDLRLPDGSGLDIVNYIKNAVPSLPVAVITAFGDPQTAVQALKSGAFDYVSKPIELEELEALVNTALKVKPVEETAPQQEGHTQLLGSSMQIQKIKALVQKVCRNQAPVHISGETGTGKELIARLIHNLGPRSDQPFIAVNCGAIPRELMESEFFGHKKGSFTGAHQDTEGLFKAADGGTLFLDEVAELPTDLQVKLLRTIQEKKVRAVGDTAEKTINVRLISATHQKLSKLIEKGTFREDFYYRINVIPVHAPPLRERLEDIPELTRFLVKRMAEENGIKPPLVEREAIEKLQRYGFPGNVRELENIMERSLALMESDSIREDDVMLPDHQNDTFEQNSMLDSNMSIDDHIEHVEIARIKDALQKSNGNITAAAELLGTSFRSLRYRIKKLEIR